LFFLKKLIVGWTQVAHTYNPNYSGCRDQKECNSQPPPANSLIDSISKKPITKRGLVERLKVEALSSNPYLEVKC
jgi:hypothetical protein